MERKGSLREALTHHAATDGKLTDALAAWKNAAPFYHRDAICILCLAARRRRRPRGESCERLGHEANDALDEFLELALGYERKAPASLQGFVAWLRAADLEVKRDMEISRDEVRVMTVHGAKGLEAPVVFLVDTTSSPSDTSG